MLRDVNISRAASSYVFLYVRLPPLPGPVSRVKSSPCSFMPVTRIVFARRPEGLVTSITATFAILGLKAVITYLSDSLRKIHYK